MYDVAVVRAGRVEQVLPGVRGARVPHGAMGINCRPGSVHPGMIFDLPSHTFHEPPTQPQASPVAGNSVSVVQHAPASAPAAGGPPAAPGGSNNQNVITLNVGNLPAPPVAVVAGAPIGQPVAVPPVPALAAVGSRPLEPFLAPASSPPGLPVPPFSPPVARTEDVPALVLATRGKLRALQVDVWPPDRERIADLASLYATYADPAMVPELVAMASGTGRSLDDVAQIALDARLVAHRRIELIGRLVDESLSSVTDAASAAALVDLGNRIAMGEYDGQ